MTDPDPEIIPAVTPNYRVLKISINTITRKNARSTRIWLQTQMKLQTGWARSEGFSYFGALTLGPPPRHLSEWIDLTYLRKFLKPVIYPGNVCVQFMSIESWGLFANNKSTWHLCYQACGSFTSQNVTKSVLEAIKTIDIEGLRTTKVHTVIMPAVHTGAINRAKSLILPTREKRTRENRIHRRKSDETDPRARFPNLLCRIIPIDSLISFEHGWARNVAVM